MLDINRLVRDTSGNVAMMFAVLLVPILVAGGIAIDMYRASAVRSELAEASDAAVLSAARAKLLDPDLTDAKATAIARKNFEGNYRNTAEFNIDVFTFVHDKDKRLFTVNVEGNMKTALLGVVGRQWTPIKVVSEAKVAPPRLLEAVLVLDNTDSMDGAKITALKSAAQDLVEAVMPETGGKVKIGVVPFSGYVNVGMSRRSAPWMSVPPDATRTDWECWNDYPDAVKSNCRTVTGTCDNDGVSSSCSWEECDWDYGEPVEKCDWDTDTDEWRGCAGSRDYPLNIKDEAFAGVPVPGILDRWCTAELLPLTTDKTAVKSKIDDLFVQGNTYIPSGLFWGQALLSSEAPFTEGATYADMAKDSGVKALILMTDGANTLSPDYPDHDDDDVSVANDLTIELCTEIKKNKIYVYTVAFEVTDATIKNLLKNCASSPDDAHDAGDAAALSKAFESIGDSLQELALSR